MDDQILDDKSRAEIPVQFNQVQPEPKWKQIWKNKLVLFSIIAAVVLIFTIGWYFLFGSKTSAPPKSNNVVLLIKGPEQLMSSNEAEYHIVYRNGENADLVNLSLEVFYPSGFRFKSSTPTASSSSGQVFNLPLVKEGKDGEVVVRGKLEGSTGESKQIKAVLHYRLSNFNSEFAVSQTLNTSILPPNLTMDINGPVDVVNGQDTTFNVTFTNVTSQDFDNLALQLNYPEGFSFSASSIPAAKNNNYWKLAKLASNSSASIDISGSFTGNDSETKLMKADLGQLINNVFAPQITSTATFRIIPSSLSVALSSDTKNGIVKLGETINYKVNYANQGSIGLNNILIVVNLEGAALDMSRLSASDAIVTGKKLTWKAATLPGLSQLSPNERGEIRFSVPLAQGLNTNIKNQTVKASGTISADEISKPTKAGDVVAKLGSEMDLVVNGDFLSGATPMEVGKTSLFAMTYLLSNLSNDLSNVKVIASLPLPAEAWKNVIIPDSEKNRLSYDPNSGKITWSIGDLAAFVGRYSTVAKVTFQIQVEPTEVDRNKAVNLLSNIEATGTDNFTGESIHTSNISNISTADIDDPSLDDSTVH